jgi:hypothetical protein
VTRLAGYAQPMALLTPAPWLDTDQEDPTTKLSQ